MLDFAPNLEETLENWHENPQKARSIVLNNLLKYSNNLQDAITTIWADFFKGADVEYLAALVACGISAFEVKNGLYTNFVCFNPKELSIREIEIV